MNMLRALLFGTVAGAVSYLVFSIAERAVGAETLRNLIGSALSGAGVTLVVGLVVWLFVMSIVDR
jgi:hypothetical protein